MFPSGSITSSIYQQPNNKDFKITSFISDEIRKYEPRNFYLILEMLCKHLEDFKGDFPIESNLKFETKIRNNNNPNELNFEIIFTKDF